MVIIIGGLVASKYEKIYNLWNVEGHSSEGEPPFTRQPGLVQSNVKQTDGELVKIQGWFLVF